MGFCTCGPHHAGTVVLRGERDGAGAQEARQLTTREGFPRAADLGGWRSGWLGRPRGQGLGVMDRVGAE